MLAGSPGDFRTQEEAYLLARALSTQVTTLRITRSLGEYGRLGKQIENLEAQAIALVHKLEQGAIPF